MSIHQTILETMSLPAEEVAALIGAGDVTTVIKRRARLQLFLSAHPWDEGAYKAWLRTAPEAWTPSEPARGLGDTVAKMTHALGIKPCGGCKQRHKDWNAALSYGERE